MKRIVVLVAVLACGFRAGGADEAEKRKGEPRVRCVEQPGLSVRGVVSGYVAGTAIYIALYDSKEHFDNAQFCRTLRFTADQATGDTIAYSFDSLPAGDYLIASYQDTDGNGKLTRGMFGMPKEPYSICRHNYGMFGPSFDKCKFRVEADYTGANLDFGT